MAREAYVFPDRKLLIYWSRKAGNTSLADWLVRIVIPEDERKGPPRRQLERRIETIDFREAARLIRDEQYANFVLCREPLRRVASAYLEKYVRYGDEPMDAPERLKKFAKRSFLEIMHMQGRSMVLSDYEYEKYPGISFIEFLEYVVDRVRARAWRGEPDLNHHWNTQVPLAYGDEGFEYANIIHLERVGEEIGGLAAMLGTDTPFPHVRSNKTEGFPVVTDQDLSEVKSIEFLKSGIQPAPAALLSPKAIALIGQAYGLDFQKLGYEAPVSAT